MQMKRALKCNNFWETKTMLLMQIVDDLSKNWQKSIISRQFINRLSSTILLRYFYVAMIDIERLSTFLLFCEVTPFNNFVEVNSVEHTILTTQIVLTNVPTCPGCDSGGYNLTGFWKSHSYFGLSFIRLPHLLAEISQKNRFENFGNVNLIFSWITW